VSRGGAAGFDDLSDTEQLKFSQAESAAILAHLD
jgi:hypothetical protein